MHTFTPSQPQLRDQQLGVMLDAKGADFKAQGKRFDGALRSWDVGFYTNLVGLGGGWGPLWAKKQPRTRSCVPVRPGGVGARRTS